jgi:hypothetical protein
MTHTAAPSPSWTRFAKRSPAFWAGAFLLVFGTIFLAAGWHVIRKEQRYRTEGQTTSGVVLTKAIERATRNGRRSETHYTVAYRFDADGRTYAGTRRVSVGTWERLREQEPLQVQYVASDPMINRPLGETSSAATYVFPGIGAVAALIGAVLFVRAVRSAQAKARVWSQGTAADAVVSAVEETNVKVNRRRMWVVRYQYRDHSGLMHDGASDYMAAEKASAWKKGDSIRVRFDPHEPATSVWVE